MSEPNGLAARPKLRPKLGSPPSGDRSDVSQSHLPLRHRRLRANLPISENCCWDRLEIARKGKSDKFGWSLDFAFLHNSVVIHFGLVLVARRFAFSEQEKKLIIDGSLLRSRISFSFPVVRSDSRVQFLARSCTKLSCRLLEKANVS